MRSFATILTTISLPLYALSAHHGNRDHSGLALRARGDVLQRDFSARMTYYDITVGPYVLQISPYFFRLIVSKEWHVLAHITAQTTS